MNFTKLGTRELQYEAQELNARHASLIDDDDLEDWPSLFTENCLYKVISQENQARALPVAAIFCTSRGMLTDRVVSLRKANIYPAHGYRHILSTTRITAAEADVIHARTNYVVLRTRENGETTLYNAGQYIDEIVFADGALRFRSKIVVFDTSRVDTLMVRPI